MTSEQLGGVTDGGSPREVRNVGSLSCTLETNTMWYVGYT